VRRKTLTGSHCARTLTYLGGKRKPPIIKEEIWLDDAGKVTRYSLAYIDPLTFPEDNGRVLGYDNAHGHHHRHYLGQVSPVAYTTFEEVAKKFLNEVRKLRKAQ